MHLKIRSTYEASLIHLSPLRKCLMTMCPSSLHSCVQGTNFSPTRPPGEIMSFGVSPVNYSDSDSEVRYAVHTSHIRRTYESSVAGRYVAHTPDTPHVRNMPRNRCVFTAYLSFLLRTCMCGVSLTLFSYIWRITSVEYVCHICSIRNTLGRSKRIIMPL